MRTSQPIGRSLIVALAMVLFAVGGLPVRASAMPVTGINLARRSAPAAPQAPYGDTGTKVGHLEVPALGINRDVFEWGCRGGDLPNRVYHWGCPPDGNIFLLGHAASVFRPLYRAKRNNTLALGMRLYYTSRGGARTRYMLTRLATLMVADVYTEANGWIFADYQPAVVTMVTCWGPNNNQRIIARFTR